MLITIQLLFIYLYTSSCETTFILFSAGNCVKSSTTPYTWNPSSLGCQTAVKTSYGGSWEISFNSSTHSYQLTEFQFPNCAGKSFIHDSDCKQSLTGNTCCTLQSPYLALNIQDQTYSNVMSWSVNGNLDEHNEIYSFYQSTTKQQNCSSEDVLIEFLPDWCYNIQGSYGTLQFNSIRTANYITEIFLDKGCTTAIGTMLQCKDSCCGITDLLLVYQNATIKPTLWTHQSFAKIFNPVYIVLIAVGGFTVLVVLIVGIVFYMRKRKTYNIIN